MKGMTWLGTSLRGMSRARKRLILVGYDSSAMLLALWASFSVRLGELFVATNEIVVFAAVLSVVIGIVALDRLQVYRIVLRFFDLQTMSRIFFGAAVAAGAWVAIVYFLRPTMVTDGRTIFVPRSIGLIYCGLLFILLFVGRYFMAALLSTLDKGQGKGAVGQKSAIIIYGANASGVSLSEAMQRHPQYKLCGFVDDDPTLWGQMAAGKPVYAPSDLPDLVRANHVSEVMLALPNATRTQRLSAISQLNELGVIIKTIPAPEEIASGRYSVTDIRRVEINDLLRRDPVQPLTDIIEDAVANCSIMVTGAGGSIGSEICRQILLAAPRKLVLFDHSEYALYTITQQILQMLTRLPPRRRPEVVPRVGSVVDEALVRDVIRREQVETIYHAAAYKHVPLLEENEVTGVGNNVFGTLAVATAALEAGLTRFTMISTDKAVRPQNVMGASKRVAELIVQACAKRSASTRFGIVRFGNVLDSSGSVVQLFRSQIEEGGPVTVTDKKVTRFFMSIPEATHLVLQASAMAESGEVFVLDMGEPVGIADLARNMIHLSGMTVRDEANPEGDIEITYVGLRPGEKLYEELFIGGSVISTAHPKIRKAIERSVPFEELRSFLDRLRAATEQRDAKSVRSILREIIEPDALLANSDLMPLSTII